MWRPWWPLGAPQQQSVFRYKRVELRELVKKLESGLLVSETKDGESVRDLAPTSRKQYRTPTYLWMQGLWAFQRLDDHERAGWYEQSHGFEMLWHERLRFAFQRFSRQFFR